VVKPLNKNANVWLALAVFAFIATRLSDVHVHVCLGGQELHDAVHISHEVVHDGAHHDETHHDEAHHDDAHHGDSRHIDQDVGTFDAVLAKKGDDSPDLAAVPFASLRLLYSSVLRTEPPRSVLSRALAQPRLRLRPPLRGPPL